MDWCVAMHGIKNVWIFKIWPYFRFIYAGNSLKTRRNSTFVRRSPGKLNDAQMYASLIMPWLMGLLTRNLKKAYSLKGIFIMKVVEGKNYHTIPSNASKNAIWYSNDIHWNGSVEFWTNVSNSEVRHGAPRRNMHDWILHIILNEIQPVLAAGICRNTKYSASCLCISAVPWRRQVRLSNFGSFIFQQS